MNSLLVDSGFLIALFAPKDDHHPEAVSFSITNRDNLVIPDVTLTEITYLLRTDGGKRAEIAFLDSFPLLGIEPEPLTLIDIRQAKAIMLKYKDAELDFVDCAIMALSERLNITQILTFDRRDFTIFRPTHCEYLELLP